MKLCRGCDTTKPLSEFHRRGNGHQARCKDCQRARDAERWPSEKKRRRHLKRMRVAELRVWMDKLKSYPCLDCDVQYPPYVMQWDHRPGTKKVADVSTMISQGYKGQAENEIQKCDLVCANCHAIRTHERRTIAQSGQSTRLGVEES